MGKSIKRDSYRKMVTELQNEIGIKKYNASRLMSQKDCITAIYEIVRTDIQNKERKEIDKYIETNRALNDINCELKKENKELKDKTLELNNQISQKNEEYTLMKHQIEEYQESLEIRQDNFDGLLNDFNNMKKQRTFILIILILIIIGGALWTY
jgi:predicted RNase H-like nuclease (RuvC/YqgF family)